MRNESRPAERVARGAVLVALGLALAAVERVIPLPIQLPGVKLGLANLVVLVALYLEGAGAALTVAVLRVALAGALFGSGISILYALSGSLAAFAVMAMLWRSGRLGVEGVSIAGGVAHNLMQLAVAALVVRTANLAWYLPVLLGSGALTGLLNGVVGRQLLKRLSGRNGAAPPD